MWSGIYMLFKNIHINSLNLSNFVNIVFDVEIALKNIILAILEQILFAFSQQQLGQSRKFSSGNSHYFTKTKMSSMSNINLTLPNLINDATKTRLFNTIKKTERPS